MVKGGIFWLLLVAIMLGITFTAETAFCMRVNCDLIMHPTNTQNDFQLTAIPLKFYRSYENLTISWIPADLECFLYYSEAPGGMNLDNYINTNVSGTATITKTPAELNLGVGAYYCVVASSNQMVSAEFKLIVESELGVTAVDPIGTIDNPTPTFIWEPNPGVPYYHLVLSDNPFVIETDENGDMSVTGFQAIWQAITPNNSIIFGSVDPSGASSLEPPPLVPGIQYNWIALNNYGNDLPYSSDVVATPVEFVYEVEDPLAAPIHTSPSTTVEGDTTFFYGDEYITFEWSEVEDAMTYRIFIAEIRLENGSVVHYTVYDQTTTNNFIDFYAAPILINADYTWKIIASDPNGNSAISVPSEFSYRVPDGIIRNWVKNVDNINLSYATVRIDAIDGSSDNAPLLVDEEGYVKKKLPIGTYVITASKEYYETVKDTVEITMNCNIANTIKLPYSPSSVFGAVVDQDGLLVQNCFIQAVNAENELRESPSTTGNFNISLTPGYWIFTASKEIYSQDNEIEIMVNAGANIELDVLVLTKNEKNVNGTVVNTSGATLAGINVFASDGNTTIQKITVSGGAFDFPGLGFGAWSFWAKKTGYYSPSERILDITNASPDIITLSNIVLNPQANIISGNTNNSIVSLKKVALLATPSSGSPISTISDEYGNYSIDLPGGNYTFTASLSKYSSQNTYQLNLGVGETTSNIDFVLVPNESFIKGTVTSGGIGLEGVLVSGGRNTDNTDNTGQYSLSVTPGTYEISVSKTSYSSSEIQEISIGAGQTVENINFTMAPNASTISGKVSSLGSGISGANVKGIKLLSTGNMVPITEIPTQSDGNYELNLLPGNYIIWAKKDNFLCPDSLSLQIQAGQKISNKNIIMVPNEATITGLTHKPDGTLLRWVNILVKDLSNSSNTTSIVTGVNGQFTVIVTPGTQYQITATKNGYSKGNDITANLFLGETHTCDFSMSALPSLIIGHVVNDLGENVSEVTISLTNEDNPENSTSAQSGLNGKYSTGIAHGTYSATAQLLGHLEESKEIEIVPGVTDTLDFVLVQNFSTLYGTIIDDQHLNIEGVMITATRSSGGGGTAQTDEVGQYSILDLLPGSYTITISKEDYESFAESNKIIPAGVSIKQDAQLEMYGSSLQVTVNQAETKYAGATITIENQSTGETVSDVTNSAGICHFTGLLANVEYVVTANAVNYYAEPQTIALNPGQEGTLEFTLLLMNSQIFGASVFQKSGSDIGLSGVNIYVLSSDGFSGNATSNADGTFNVQNLNPGREYQITLVKTDYTDVDRNPVNLTEESQSVGTLYMIPNNRKINGIVEDQQETVLENIPVQAVSENASGESTTNSSGEFTIFGLAPLSSYTVSTNKEEQGWTNVEKQVEIEESENNSAGTLLITINDARIYGTIKDSNTDEGIIGANIILTNNTTGLTYTKTSQPSDGNYTFRYLTAENYTLKIIKELYQTKALDITINDRQINEQNILLDYSAPVDVTGILKDTDSRGIPDKKIYLVNDQQTLFTTTESGGSFSFSNNVIPYTTTTISTNFDAGSYDNDVRELSIENSNVNSDLIIDIHASHVTGTIKDNSNSELINNSEISLYRENGSDQYELISRIVSGDGNFSITKLYEGAYKIIAVSSGYYEQNEPSEFTLNDFQDEAIEIILTPLPNALTGLITTNYNDEELILSNTTVTLYQNESIISIDTTTSAGTFQFINLTYNDEYTINSDKTGFSEYDETFQFTETENKLNITMQMVSNSILGTISYENQKMQNIPVYAKSLEGYLHSTLTDDFGDFLIDGVVGYFDFWSTNEDTSLVSLAKTVEIQSNSSIYEQIELVTASTIKGTVTYNGVGKGGVNIAAENINTGAIFSAITNPNGIYKISGLNAGTYRVDVYLEGFQPNENAQVRDLGTGETVIFPDFTLTFTNNSITGVITDSKSDRGISNAEVILKNSTSIPIDTLTTKPDGNFLFTGLDDGDFIVSVFHAGYEDIDTENVNLSNGISTPPTLDFILIPKELTIFGKIHDNRDRILPGADLVISSNDTTVFGQSDDNGLYSIKTGKPGIFDITVTKTHYDKATSVAELTFGNNNIEKNFLLTPDPSSISGQFWIIDHSGDKPDTTNVNFGTIHLVGQNSVYDNQIVVSNNESEYSFHDLIEDNYKLNIDATYYVDGNPIEYFYENDIALNIAEDYINEKVYFLYNPDLSTINGEILILDDTEVPVTHAAIYLFDSQNAIYDSTNTNSEGEFQIQNIAIDEYKLTVHAVYDNEHFFYESELFSLTTGESKTINHTFEYVLCSFFIKLTEDGIVPITEAKIQIISEDQNITLYTDESGNSSTDSIFHTNKDILLKVTKNIGTVGKFIEAGAFAINFNEISHRNISIQLPLQFDDSQISPVAATDSIPVHLFKSQNYTDEVQLYYQNVDGNQNILPMTQSDNDSFLVANIPAQRKFGNISFFFKSQSDDLGLQFSSENAKYDWQITSEGILADKYSTLSPSEPILTYRDSSLFEVELQDDIGNSLNNDIESRGHVEWSLSGASLGNLIQTDNKRRIIFTSPTEVIGDLSGEIKADVILDGVRISIKTRVQVRDMRLSTIQISGPTEVSNDETVFYSIKTISVSGYVMTIPIEWEKLDSTIGVTSREKGGILFTPDSSFLGDTKLIFSATDKNYDTTIVIEQKIAVFKQINADMAGDILSTGYECSLVLPDNMLVTGTARIYVKPILEIPAMKQSGIENGLESLIFDIKSNKSESSFNTLPGLRFDVDIEDGSIAYWNNDELKWEIPEDALPSAKSVALQSIFLDEILGWLEYGVVAPSQPLGIYDLKIAPNPFTPYDQIGKNMGMQIGFKLSSDKSRYPNITAKIYNMKGTLVRTLSNNAPMEKGEYGIGEPNSLYWDGKTDDGSMARNGRYILHLIVKDASKEKQILKSIVLIK